jgi:KUP system potassium uptake protein
VQSWIVYLPLQLSFSCVVYPSVVITYLGQAAYLYQNPDDYANTFYASIPNPVYWPMFVIATLAAIVASQVCISTPLSEGILVSPQPLCHP